MGFMKFAPHRTIVRLALEYLTTWIKGLTVNFEEL